MTINNKYSHITNHTQLMYSIMQVNAARVQQEDDIKYQLKELYYSLQPATLIKKAVRNVLHSPEIQKDLAQAGVAVGVEFLICKFFKKGKSVKGFLSSMIVGKIADYALHGKSDLLNNGISKIGNMLKQFKK